MLIQMAITAKAMPRLIKMIGQGRRRSRDCNGSGGRSMDDEEVTLMEPSESAEGWAAPTRAIMQVMLSGPPCILASWMRKRQASAGGRAMATAPISRSETGPDRPSLHKR